MSEDSSLEYKKYQSANSKVSELEIELESARHKYEMEAARANKLAKGNSELSEANNNL